MSAIDYELLRLPLESSRYGAGPGYSAGTGFGAPGIAGDVGAFGDGPHAGRGPRGYRRSDERIQEDVCEALTRHGELDASGIEVEVEDGEVRLRGTVPDRRTKRAAVAVAETVPWVEDVHTELRARR